MTNSVKERVTKGAQEFRGLAADSREVRPGFLFAALSGSKSDGARFMAEAVKRGAVAVLGVPEAAAQARTLGVRFIADANPRRRLALLAADFYRIQPQTIAAVTGTNGKTSATVFLRQIWERQGRKAASLGTIGIVAPSGETSLNQTTPDPLVLYAELARLAREGVSHLAMEASSHGLDQFRLDGVRMQAAAFTNITRDHMDYHPTPEQYLATKLRLFDSVVQSDGVAVVNADATHADAFIAAAARRKLHLLTVGKEGKDLRLAGHDIDAHRQRLTLRYQDKDYKVSLPLPGLFQAYNALIAAAIALALADAAKDVFAALEELRGPPGRLQLVARARTGAPIYVDYAHTPDALETVLMALRPHVEGRLHVVFGCGGDRDPGKRPLMGIAAARCADAVIVTDDNPRSENPAAIRREALAGCPGAREIGDRGEAIHAAIAALESGDALVIAGKGHEQGQIVGAETRAFSDRNEAVKAALALGGRAEEGA